MNIRILMLLCIFIFLSLFANPVQSRQILNFNRDWKFTKGNLANAELPDFNDSSWEKFMDRLIHWEMEKRRSCPGVVKPGIGKNSI